LIEMIQGKKIKMTQVFDQAGKVIPVTLIDCDIADLKVGQKIKITSTSKGKGFQGVVKRWGFKGAPKTHGTKHGLRSPGSIGSTNLERVVKGKKMAGRTGGERKTLKNLEIIEIRDLPAGRHGKQIAIKGAVPGNRGSKIEIFNS